MRLGLAANFTSNRGGVYQYTLAVLHALENLVGQERVPIDVVLLTDNVEHPTAVRLGEKGWDVSQFGSAAVGQPVWVGPLVRRLLGERLAWEIYRRRRPIRLEVAEVRAAARDWLASTGARMMMYPAPTPLSFEGGMPYVMAVHDLQHRLNPQFPEVSANGVWERREHLLRNGTRNAVRVLADSDVGKEDILEAYAPFGVTEDKVKVLPFVPPPYLDEVVAEEEDAIRARYSLPEQYLFYPAQFWPHKNHLRIVEALGLLKQRHGWRIPIVFCGSRSGRLRRKTFRDVNKRAHQLGIEDDLRYIGYAEDAEMAALYSGAVGLVMPTFFGPTNIPILEAWKFGCPVITSDLRGIREQAGDAAVLVDPESVEALADGISKMWLDEALRRTLVEKGRQKLAMYTSADFRQHLVSVLQEAYAEVDGGSG